MVTNVSEVHTDSQPRRPQSVFLILSVKLKSTPPQELSTTRTEWRQIEYQSRHANMHLDEEILQSRIKYGETYKCIRKAPSLFNETVFTARFYRVKLDYVCERDTWARKLSWSILKYLTSILLEGLKGVTEIKCRTAGLRAENRNREHGTVIRLLLLRLFSEQSRLSGCYEFHCVEEVLVGNQNFGI